MNNKNNNGNILMDREVMQILRELSERTASLEVLIRTQIDGLKDNINKNSNDLNGLDRYVRQMREDFSHDITKLNQEINKCEDLLKQDIKASEEIARERVGEYAKKTDSRIDKIEKFQWKAATAVGVFVTILTLVLKYGDFFFK